MSIIHYIKPRKRLDIHSLNNNLYSCTYIRYENRGETFYYWHHNQSARGIDITLYSDYIEIRNTILSNEFDYKLTNYLAGKILDITKGEIVDEEDGTVSLPLFNEDKIEKQKAKDCSHIRTLSQTTEDLVVYGPIRKVHFGKCLYSETKHLSDSEYVNKLFRIITDVQYNIPDYGYGNIMEVGDGEDKKIIKVITSNISSIIDKYDYVILNRENDNPILITNAELNSILPEKWKLMDEFTIVADSLNEQEWFELLSKAEPMDKFQAFINKQL